MLKLKKTKQVILSAIVSIFISSPLLADDIEIYTGTEDTDSNVNILFMLDTSGSMRYNVSGSSESRMEQAKDALTEVISQLPGDMNVGLGRFNEPGGSILYPARALDDEITASISKKPSDVDDDAYEREGKTEETFINTDELLFEPSVVSVSARIDNDYFDAEECPDGTKTITTNQYADIESDTSYCQGEINAFVFQDLNIPQGATIVSAQMELSTYSASNNVSAEINIENNVDPNQFDVNTNKIKTRSYFTDSETWDFEPTSIYEKNYSPDLSVLIQPLISDSGWDANSNGIGIKLTSSKSWKRNTYFTSTFDYSSYRPVLRISYKEYDDNNLVGIKFSDLQIGTGATVSQGLLKLTASQSNGTGNLYISTESGSEPESYVEETNNISDRTKDSTQITFSFTDWEAGEVKYFDVTSLLQTKINETDWCGGNDVNFILETDLASAVYSLDHSTEYSPELILSYDGGDSSSCLNYTSVTQIEDYNDDSYEGSNSKKKNYPYASSVISKNNNLSGFIFRTTDIPPTATINEAYIQLTTHSNTDEDDTFKFDLYLKKPSSYPVSGYENSTSHLSDRFTNLVGGDTWTISSGATNNAVYKSHDISSEIESIISSSAYANADAADRSFEVILDGQQKKFYSYSYDDNPGKSAKLVIVYESNSSAISSMTTNTASTISTQATTTTDSPVTVRQYLIELIEEQPNSGTTPMEGALYEAGLYFLGDSVDYGRSRNASQTSSSVISSQRISGEDSYTGGTIVYPSGCESTNLDDYDCANIYISGDPVYTSPMTSEVCETNNIILITDGYPNSYNSYTSSNKNYDNVPLSTLIYQTTGESCNDSWSCASAWVSYLYNTDFMTSKAGTSNVYTHIISFNLLDSEGNLRDLANDGGGVYVTSTNTSDLIDSLNIVISSIMDIESTLATPGVAVNQNKRTEHLSDIYYSVFQPTVSKYWSGNLKKYSLDSTSTEIVDKYGENAVDDETGFFKEGTTSFWSDEEDGGIVENGGAASKQTLTNRKIFTYTSSASPNNVNLNQESHEISEDNNDLSMDLFNLTSSDLSTSEFKTFLSWLRGVDVFDDNFDGSTSDIKQTMGDPLHSRPLLVSYSDDENIIFVSNNEGFLHAVDSSTGEEKFAFMPQELLPNAYEKYLGGSGDHLYGLDSSWVAWRNDVDNDGEIEPSDGDFVYLYSGMRRGGNTFYALDVSDLDNPKLKYIIDENTSTEFENLGQTWSEPVLAKVKVNGVDKIVLIFGGGYDTSYDSDTYNSLIDTYGNYLYMLDASTGELLWSASATGNTASLNIENMNYSIVSKPALLDLNGDTYLDTIYVTDMGSQILKFKINNDNTGMSSLVSGKVIAKLGKSTGDTSLENTRMMFDALAAAPIMDGTEKYIALVSGTGYRAHPLDTTKKDALFMIKDKEDYYTTTSEEITVPFVMSDLADLTDDIDSDSIDTKLANKKGYYLWLRESDGTFMGEKMTGEPLIYDNQIYLNTYFPDDESIDCTPVVGYVRGYRMDVTNATPTQDTNDDGQTTTTDRYLDNLTSGIANGSKIIYTSEGVYLLTNTTVEQIGSGGSLGANKKRWYQKNN